MAKEKRYFWIVVENSTGDVYLAATYVNDKEEVYKLFGIEVLKMDPSTLDTGNVDVNVYKLPEGVLGPSSVVKLNLCS